MALGENLRHARKRIGRSQLDVARDIGISNADLETLKRLANYYDVTIDELAGNTSMAREILYDLSSIVKNGRIAHNGVEYVLSDSQRLKLRRQIAHAFEMFNEGKSNW